MIRGPHSHLRASSVVDRGFKQPAVSVATVCRSVLAILRPQSADTWGECQAMMAGKGHHEILCTDLPSLSLAAFRCRILKTTFGSSDRETVRGDGEETSQYFGNARRHSSERSEQCRSRPGEEERISARVDEEEISSWCWHVEILAERLELRSSLSSGQTEIRLGHGKSGWTFPISQDWTISLSLATANGS